MQLTRFRALVPLLSLALAACSSGKTAGPGPTGVQGPGGPPGQSVTATPLAAGDTHCGAGGTSFNNGTSATYLCNGLKGTTGAPGTSVTSTPLSAGDANCAQGGSAFTAGNATTYADYRGRFLRGVDHGAGHDPDAAARTPSTLGGNAGDAPGSLQAAAFAAHGHGIKQTFEVGEAGNANDAYGDPGTRRGVQNLNYRSGNRYYSNFPDTLATGGNETRPVNASVNYMVKA